MVVAWTRRPQRNSRALENARCLGQEPEGDVKRRKTVAPHIEGPDAGKGLEGKGHPGCMAHALLGPGLGPRLRRWAGLGQREGPAPP